MTLDVGLFYGVLLPCSSFAWKWGFYTMYANLESEGPPFSVGLRRVGLLWCDIDNRVSDLWNKLIVPTFPDLFARDNLTQGLEKAYVEVFQVQCLQPYSLLLLWGWMSKKGS